MYFDCSLRGDPKKDKLIDELNFKNCMHLSRIQKSKFFFGITVKQRKFIIHPEFMVANHIIADKFIQNLKSNPNKVHDLPSQMKRSLKKQILEKIIKLKIQKITRITDNNGKTEYHGITYANNVVSLESGWICDNFEFREPEFYKLVTTVTCDENQHKTHIVPVGRCALHTSQDEPNIVDIYYNASICLGGSNKKEERVTDGPTVKYSQGIKNSCIVSSLSSGCKDGQVH